jgi:predicted kinase
MLSFNEFLEITEGVNDPAIFKAVFLAGGPGSGKSFVVKQTALSAMGFKLINSDPAFEAALKKAGLDMGNPEHIFSPKGQEVRAGAKAITKKQLGFALDGRLGLTIDGTGKDFEKIKGQVDKLRALGYDCAMMFVNTDLDTAIARNQARDRSLPDPVVEKMWKDVQKNIGKFQNLFGRHMYIIDNSDNANWQGATQSAYKRINAWSKNDPTSPVAKKWIAQQKNP